LASNGKRKPKTLVLGGIGGDVLVSAIEYSDTKYFHGFRSEMAEQVKFFKLGGVYVLRGPQILFSCSFPEEAIEIPAGGSKATRWTVTIEPYGSLLLFSPNAK